MGIGRSRLINMNGPEAEIVKQFIAQNEIAIFSKRTCPFCKMAKEIFDKINKKYKSMELDDRHDAAEIQDILGELTGARTVPRVFIRGKFIGGGSDVKNLYESGELVTLFD